MATLARVTTDPFEALAAGDVLLAFVPPSDQSAYAEVLLPLVEPRHILVMLPGNLGSLAHAKWLRDRGHGAGGLPTIVESDTTPCVCRRLGPQHLHIDGVVPHVGFGVFPACRTTSVLAALAPLFPGARKHPHVLAAALGALDPIVRPPCVLLNAGRIEDPLAEFCLYREGLSPGVVRVIEALDGERLAIAAALGLDPLPAARALHAFGLGPSGDLWATLHGSIMLAETRGPESLRESRLADDVTFGLRSWVELGEQLGVSTPVCRMLVTLCDVATGVDSWRTGRSLDDLGIAGMTPVTLAHYLETGSDDETV